MLNKLVKRSTALSHLHTFSGIPSGPTAFPLRTLVIDDCTFFLLILHTCWFTIFTPSPLVSLFLIFFSHKLFIVLLPSSLHTFFILASTFRSQSLITLTCCTSFLALSRCLANRYALVSPSLVPRLTYNSIYAFFPLLLSLLYSQVPSAPVFFFIFFANIFLWVALVFP